MRTFLALTRRELMVYFVSPSAYIILPALLVLSGLAFMKSVSDSVAYQLPFDYFGTLFFIVWVVVMASPLITMRLIAEEKNLGTLEGMMTVPISETQFVLAKFAGAMSFLVFLLLFTVSYPLLVEWSQPGQVDFGATLCGYFGALLIGALIFSIGIFISALCPNQVTSGIITFMLALLLFFASMLAGGLGEHPLWSGILGYVNLTANFFDFIKGIVDLQRLVYLSSGVVFFLFLTTRVIESRRWR